MMRQLFGTDGIRGVPGCFPLDDPTVFGLGRALGELVVQSRVAAPRVLIGIDTRESGSRLARLLAAGLSAAEAEPVSAGVITTPGVATLVSAKGFAGGAVVSASHNPFPDNGIKLFGSRGMKFSDAIEQELEAELLRHRDAAESIDVTGLDSRLGFAADYLELLRARADVLASLAGLSVVLDCANGAASRLGPELFCSLEARVTALSASPDGRNINAGCGSLHPEAMCQAVVACGAAFGVAFDGDADRAIFSTASGRLMDGDGVLYLAARVLRADGRLRGNVVVGTTMTNLGLERALAREGIGLLRVPVGDRYVLEEMLRRNSNLGGEPSGHVIFLDDSPAGDGLATALKVAAWVVRNGTLDELLAGLELYPQRIVNVTVREKPPLDSLPEVVRVAALAKRALGDYGRIVLRYSGTEKLARVMVEAEREVDVTKWSHAIAAAIDNAIGAA
jgi:phosphoglucosamine mutase